jgi:transcription initiation factor TFIIH subunit 2
MFEEDDDEEVIGSRLQATDGAYLWERGVARLNFASVETEAQPSGRSQLEFGGAVGAGPTWSGACRRGLARHLVVVLDCSSSMERSDPPPSRLVFVVQELRAFLGALFRACPLSSVSLLATCNGTCARLCSLSSSLTTLNAALDAIPDPSGLPSVQHALDMATAELRYSPSHCTRELLLVLSSLSTADPGSIHNSITAAIDQGLVINTLHLAAEVHIFKQMALKSGGTHR